MGGTVPRTPWIVAPPELCVLCKEPLTDRGESSSWNGQPAHRNCVRVHMIQRDPAFREWQPEEAEEPSESAEEIGPREDEDEDMG